VLRGDDDAFDSLCLSRRDRFAIYLAVFSDGHPHIDLLFSLGPWGDGTTPAMRTAFPVRYMMLESGLSLMLVDKAWSPWDTDFFGRMLDRDEALEHPLKREIFDLSDHIWRCDQPIVDFLFARHRPS
jgi:hypothetical protein